MRPITCSLSPNAQAADVRLAVSTLMAPWTWSRDDSRSRVIASLRRMTGRDRVTLYGSARAALTDALRVLGIGTGDEVIIQSFTCMVVANAVRAAGAAPVYADIGPDYNIDPHCLGRLKTPRTKAVVVQHTFGIPADVDAIRKAVGPGIAVIEDCAHGLGASYRGKPVGSLGDAAVFSFGRDKAVSSVWGGALAFGNGIHTTAHSEPAPFPPRRWIVSQLLHPVLFALALPVYRIGIGKAMIEAGKRAGLVSLPVTAGEKNGGVSRQATYAYPEPLAALADLQLSRLPHTVTSRRAAAAVYRNTLSGIPGVILPPERPGSSWLRYPVRVQDPSGLIARCRDRGILLGHWYGNVIDPAGSDLAAAGYSRGACPEAEAAASSVVNLPTTVSLRDARLVADAIVSYLGAAGHQTAA